MLRLARQSLRCERNPSSDARIRRHARRGSSNSTGLPAGSSSRICLPPKPVMTSLRKRTPAARSRSTSVARSSTSSWMRFQPPGSGLRPGAIPMTVQALKAGAVDFLTKPFRDQQLLDAVQQAIDRDRAARRQWADVAELRRRYESLTQRGREVMTLVVTGLLNKQIAAQLHTSKATMKAHRAQLMRKMEADSVAQLVRIAEGLSLLPPRR